MDRETRDKFVAGTQEDLTTGNACWETPPKIFEKLNADFGPFDVDLTADFSNKLCAVWLGPGSTCGLHAGDALTCPWHLYGTKGYSNPPYGKFVPKILLKAKDEARKGFSSTFLLPMRVTKAFRQHILCGADKLLFCDKRICFWEQGHPRWNQKALKEEGLLKPDPALFDSIIVTYSPDALVNNQWREPHVGVWQVPPHVSDWEFNGKLAGQTA